VEEDARSGGVTTKQAQESKMPAKKKVTKKKVSLKKKPLAAAVNYNVRNKAALALMESRERKRR
jgi:hypothetical protein